MLSARICSTLPAALVKQGIVGRKTSVSGRQALMQRKREDRLDYLEKGCKFLSEALRRRER